MPRYCKNTLSVEVTENINSKMVLNTFIQKAKLENNWGRTTGEINPQDVFSMANFIPGDGRTLDKMYLREIWGVKSEALDSKIIAQDDDSITYQFFTEWDPPKQFIKQVSKLYPDLIFILSYKEISTNSIRQMVFRSGEYVRQNHLSNNKIFLPNNR
jgi:hypothetical protein